MYIAMNRFKVSTPRAGEFEDVWAKRERHLSEVPGFQSFKLLKGVDEEGVTIFASHTTWASKKAFVDWTESEAFRKAPRRRPHPGRRYPRPAQVRRLRSRPRRVAASPSRPFLFRMDRMG